MRKNILYFFISILISAILLCLVLGKFGIKEIWQSFLSFSPVGAFWILILTILYNLTAVWRWQSILKGGGYNISSKKIAPIWLAGIAVGYFTPIAVMGDGVVRAHMLKRNTQVSWKGGITSILIDKIFEGSIFLLIIILGIVVFISGNLAIPSGLGVILLLLLFPILGITFFYSRAFKSQSIIKFISKPVEKFIQGKMSLKALDWEKEVFDFFEVKNKNMWRAVIFCILRGMICWLRCWSLLYFLGLNASGLVALVIAAFTNLSYLFPLPAAIGSHEALQTFAFSQVGLAARSAVAFSFILRAFDSLLYLIGGLIAFHHGVKWTGEKFLNIK